MATRTRTSSYQRVTQADEYHSKAPVDTEEKKRSKSNTAELISVKIHAFLWIAGASALIYFLDIFNVMFNDQRVNRTYFNIALICFGINCCITFYLAIWLPRIQKIKLEWSVYCPRMIPTAAFVGVVAAFGFTLGLWPVWGFFTPGILFILFIASLMTAHFLPAI